MGLTLIGEEEQEWYSWLFNFTRVADEGGDKHSLVLFSEFVDN